MPCVSLVGQPLFLSFSHTLFSACSVIVVRHSINLSLHASIVLVALPTRMSSCEQINNNMCLYLVADIMLYDSTGASSGIGEACAREFAKEGSNLVWKSEEKKEDAHVHHYHRSLQHDAWNDYRHSRMNYARRIQASMSILWIWMCVRKKLLMQLSKACLWNTKLTAWSIMLVWWLAWIPWKMSLKKPTIPCSTPMSRD